MHDAGLVRARERVGHLAGLGEQATKRSRAFRELIAQRPPVDELHRDVRRVVGAADLVDRDDARMVERRGRSRLLLEAGQSFRRRARTPPAAP